MNTTKKTAGNQQVNPKSTTKVVENQPLTVQTLNDIKSDKKRTEKVADLLTELTKSFEFLRLSEHYVAADVVTCFLIETEKETPVNLANLKKYLTNKLKSKQYVEIEETETLTETQARHLDDLAYFVAAYHANKDLVPDREKVGTIIAACGAPCDGEKKSFIVDRLYYGYMEREKLILRALPIGGKFKPNKPPKQAATK